MREKKRRPRGSVPPTLALDEAIAITIQLYERAGGEATYDALATIMDNSPSSSTFIKKIAALKNYGLVGEENRVIRLAELGRRIVAPRDDAERADAKKRAFLNIEVFAQLYDKYKGKILPQDEFLANVIGESVPRELTATWLDRFKQSAKVSGIFRDRGDGKLQVRESPDVPTSVVREEIPESVSRPREIEPKAEELHEVEPSVAYGHVSKISLSEGRQAVFSMPDRLSDKDAKKLKGALQGLVAIIDSMVDEKPSDALPLE